jgi:hypothetical protein
MPFKKGQSGNPSGKPKGAKHKSTLDKEAAREVLREMVKAELQPMTEAQIKHAKGISYLVYRDKKGGKFTVKLALRLVLLPAMLLTTTA